MKKRFYQLGKQVLSLSAVIAGTLLFSNQVSAQGVSINGTGTGTAPDASAILDLNVSGITPKKGFLAPRVALTGSGDASTITSPATSLIVYNTATGGGVSPGFYYNSGTPGAPSWVSIGGSGSAPTAGNDIDVSGTQVDVEPILNYVNTIYPTSGGGTGVSSDLTLNAPFLYNIIFQSNGVEAGRFASGGNFGIGDASPAQLFTVGSGDKFQVDANGDMVKIKNLTYSWPAAHAAGVLKNNGTGTLTWGAPTISNAAALTNGKIWIGDAFNIAQEQTMSGDATISNTGALTLATVATAGTSTKVTYNAKGLVTSGTAAVLASADFANQGTTTNVLHGNAAGNPSWGAVTGADFGTQVANTVFSGPASGANAIPTFRTMVPLDLASSPTNGEVLGVTAGVLDWVPTLTNPMTNAGDMIYAPVAGVPAAAVRFPAGTNGNVLHTTGGLPSWSPLNMAGGATEVTGILPVANGGTGVNTIATNGIMLGAGTSPVTTLVGTDMQTVRNNAGVWTAANNMLNNGTVVGIGGLTTAQVTASTAKLDINGDNSSTTSLRLRSGNPNVGSGATQIAFGYNGTSTFEHYIKTRHASGSNVANAMEFWLSLTGGTAVRTAFFDGQGGLSLNSETTSFSTRIVPTLGQTQDYTITLPNTVSAAGKALVATDAVGTLAWTTVGAGTVTSIATGTGLTGGPITTTGTIAMANMAALSVKGNATNASAAPTDIAGTANQVLRVDNAGAVLGFGSINLASSSAVTGILPVANGGTGLNSFGNWKTFYTDGSGVLTPLALGGAGTYLKSVGPAAAPIFETVANMNADLTVQNGLYLSSGTTYDGSTAVTVKQGGALTENTAITQGSFTYSLSGNTINLNDAAAASATNIGTGTTTGTVTIGGSAGQTIAIGTGAAAKLVSVGSTSGASSLTESVGTGNYVLNGVGGSTYTIAAATTTGTITIGGTAQTGAITLGSSSGAQTLNLGTGAGLSTVNIANGAAANVVNINNGAAAGTVQIGNSNKMTITNLGVGIGGLATATNALLVVGKVKSTGINETSDVRLKMNFASIDGALNKVLSMNGKYYDWRTTEFPNRGLEEGRQVGVIAQEIETILPEVVVTDDDGFKSVEYGHIVPVLIEAIKEQQKIIDGQKTTINDLKASLENVLNRVNIIEKNVDLNSSKVEK